jgi:hypothetical protein
MTVVVQAATHPALEALAQLGANADDMAHALHRLGVTGVLGGCTRCPLANHLVDVLGLRMAEVAETEMALYWPGSADRELVDMPPPAAEFVVRFDRGDFPQLVAHRSGGEQ